eukprot:CAMPEP_0172947018 /NCGR_PEP_ID=MMETSP1075-20121228/227357_1 /TAXON_ID=2916 /ORGANISM="Ceratium fusus, Strain PA161109" /LENGTH=95 /DNA_ID=CAMNT_0013808485 /DNA_START=45 /DNA_END=332 /DNA_ORIENTATION=-
MGPAAARCLALLCSESSSSLMPRAASAEVSLPTGESSWARASMSVSRRIMAESVSTPQLSSKPKYSLRALSQISSAACVPVTLVLAHMLRNRFAD